MDDVSHLSRAELEHEYFKLRRAARHRGGRGSIPQMLVSALADIAGLKQQIAAMKLEPSAKDALIRQQARRIHGQRAANRVDWQIVETRNKWRESPRLRRYIHMVLKLPPPPMTRRDDTGGG